MIFTAVTDRYPRKDNRKSKVKIKNNHNLAVKRKLVLVHML